MILPSKKAPELAFDTVDGQRWVLAERTPETFSLVVVYRGLHCPLCKKQLRELQDLRGKFADQGVEIVAVSTDTRERAVQTKDEWGLDSLTLGHSLDFDMVRSWGMFISSGLEDEPEKFAEPGLFLVKPDGTLYFAAVQNMPFARPHLKDLLSAVESVVESDYPARGDLAA